MASTLPDGWSQKQSKSRNLPYYINDHTGETTWDLPTSPAIAPEATKAPVDNRQVQVLHILKKHNKSRRPASWRCGNITQSKEVSIDQILAIKARLENKLQNDGFDEMRNLFCEIAQVESDCGSAERGGDLGMFGRGQMQKAFEEVSFKLAVGGLSGIVDTDSGIHVILRIA